MHKRLGFILNITILGVLMAGCASTRPLVELRRERPSIGLYHEVKRGETLWYISKSYNVDIKEIINSNRLPDATKINVGQRLFIPSGSEKTAYSDIIEIDKTKSSEGTFSWPVAGKVISYFGSKKGLVTNKGIDIETREGSNVVAADNGTVSFVDENMRGLGKTIVIDHQNGFSTVYAHNSKILVQVGQRVKRNQSIAKAGKTGRATKPYLHFQIREAHEPRNPLYYLP